MKLGLTRYEKSRQWHDTNRRFGRVNDVIQNLRNTCKKIKKFIAGEHINYDPSNPGKGLGDVSIKPSGFYYRV